MTPRRTHKAVAAETWRLMMQTAMVEFSRASGVLQDLGLTGGHVKLLMLLDPGDGRSMKSLAEAFRCDASTMTWLVDRLEERGLVERRTSPSDRRVKTVALTEDGIATKSTLMQRMYDPPPELLELDGETLDALAEALRRIHARRP